MNKYLSLTDFIRDITGTPLLSDFDDYLRLRPSVFYFWGNGRLDTDLINKLLQQLDLDYGAELISENLYNVLKGVLTNEG